MGRYIFVVSLFLFSACAVSADVPQSPKKVHEIELHEVHPESLEDLWDAAKLVVRARVLSTHAHRRQVAGGRSQVYTEARLLVSEFLKGAPGNRQRDPVEEPHVMVVQQLAGTVEEQGIIFTVIEVEPLKTGGEYVIFLGWNDHYEYWVVRGQESVFEVRHGKVKPLGQSKVAVARRESPIDAFLGELRGLARVRSNQR